MIQGNYIFNELAYWLLVADDLRINLGLYQNHTNMLAISQTNIHTPNIDALGARGVIFDKARAVSVPVMQSLPFVNVDQSYQLYCPLLLSSSELLYKLF